MNNTFPKLIEFTEYVAYAGGTGYKLLSEYKLANQTALTPKNLFSMQSNSNHSIEEWLNSILSYILSDETQVIEKKVIKYQHSLHDFLDSLSLENRINFKEYLLDEIVNYIGCYDEFDEFDEIPLEDVEDFLLSHPLKVFTVSSRLFNTKSRFLYVFKSAIAALLANKLGFSFNSLETTLVDYNILNNYTTDILPQRTLTIVTREFDTWEDLDDSLEYPLEDLDLSCDLAEALTSAYLDLKNT